MPKRSWDYWLLWAVALISVAGNALIINALLQARRQAGDGAAQAAVAVGRMRAASINYTMHIDEAVPVSLDVPFKTTVVVPISVTLPINTEVTAELNTLLGPIPVTVPIHTLVPVNLRTEVPINLTVPISASVPVKFDVPVNLDLATTKMGDALAGVQASLEKAAQQLRGSPIK
jgi:hypothetical protein